MKFGIDHRDSPRAIRLKLLYLVPFLFVALPCVLVTHGVVGFAEVIHDLPKQFLEIRWRLKGGRAQ